MNVSDKVQFVKDLTDSVTKEVVEKIENGTVPEHWDGHELREYLAAMFERQTTRFLDRQRKRGFVNDMITRNL